MMVRRRKIPEERRREIVTAAARLAGKAGLGSISLRSVAQEAGVAPGLVNHYFPAVEQLVAEAFAQVGAEDLKDQFATIRKESAPVQQMRLYLKSALADQPDSMRLLAIEACYLARYQPLLSDVLTVLFDAWDMEMSRLIDEGTRSGAFQSDDPLKSAIHIFALIDGFALQAVALSRARLGIVREMTIHATERELGLATGSLQFNSA
ncbi:TetR family transcriptional regulator [Nordella sp. HKS 07]|uniref:TetR/AcrR family transcriptional regulator n=1 Tax=Nordella sp. HKS 07 TaxID=2712222 RepID=UPI0013E1FA40|nr:TetR family transcriptional regulator [Nordella sp. HKS 07]QIG50181.1 TetR family transcriptional regulator [Nordella sp. HKS 07]